MEKLKPKPLKFGEALTRMQMKDIKGGYMDPCGADGPMSASFCISGDQGDDQSPCTPGWALGGLSCPNGGICCGLVAPPPPPIQY